jgi:hypothetical protein
MTGCRIFSKARWTFVHSAPDVVSGDSTISNLLGKPQPA